MLQQMLLGLPAGEMTPEDAASMKQAMALYGLGSVFKGDDASPTLQSMMMMDMARSKNAKEEAERKAKAEAEAKARREAVATECANELGGNTAFWSYTDRLFEITPSNDGLDLSLLPQIAREVGLDVAQFETCLDSGRYDQHIEDDYQDATASGGRGTPYSVIISPSGNTFPLSGVQPYTSVKSVIDVALKDL